MAKNIELLAPSGDIDAFTAAVENGADAVYLGGKLFSARQLATNFDAEGLKNAIEYAHVRDVNVYLTMNTLATDSEMPEALEIAGQAYEMGIDGIIVQDIGLAGLLRKVYPKLDLHASTQMTVYNLEGVKMLEQLGFKRVVLARELSIGEVNHIAKNTPLEIEIFTHGALCISYSGQCLMSSIIGGRSGNRGKCAQPCRLPYELVTDEQTTGKSFLLSPKDLCSVNILREIIDSGVKSLKIEGRMKNPEYVATVVRIYRKYIDSILEGHSTQADKQDLKELTQIFNRGGFSNGYLTGKSGSSMMCYEKPKNWGVYVGEVISYDRGTTMLKLRLSDELSIGDGIEVWNGEDESPSTIVTEIRLDGKNVTSGVKGTVVSIGSLKGKVYKGNKVYKTSDKKLNTFARESFAKGRKKVKIEGEMTVKNGVPVKLVVRDNCGNEVQLSGSIPEIATNRPLTRERIIEQLNKTGNTPFEFSNIDINLDDNLAVPVSEINNIRRSALEKLEVERTSMRRRVMSNEEMKIKENLLHFPGNSRRDGGNLKISAFIYNPPEKFDYTTQIDRLYLPFSYFLHEKSRQTVERCRENGKEIFVALPPVTRGNYDRLIKEKLRDIVEQGIRGILVGNIGAIEYVREFPSLKIMGDYHLNVFNSFSIQQLAELNLNGITLSPELTLGQINSLNDTLEKEAVVYGRLTLMTSEYCPVGSAVGGFKEGRACSGACQRGLYRLKDRLGIEFPILCDNIDCRSTILNANVLLIPESLGKLKSAGVSMVRLNISDEQLDEVKKVVEMHRDIIENGGALKKYEQLIGHIKEKGFTKGHYFRGV